MSNRSPQRVTGARIDPRRVENAAPRPGSPMDLSSKAPDTAATMSAISRTELQGSELESLAQLRHSLTEWADALSTEDHSVTP